MRFRSATGIGLSHIYDAICFIECGTFTISPYFFSFWRSVLTRNTEAKDLTVDNLWVVFRNVTCRGT